MSVIRKNLPNALTCCNLICGCIATGFAFSGSFGWALAFIVGGAVFDFFDGFVARLLGVSSPVGVELDSLADDITFGFAPATIVYALLRDAQWPLADSTAGTLLPYLAFLMAAFSALRLAKFNLDTRQTTSFIGLPTPANALFWGALAVGWGDAMMAWAYSPYVLLLGVLLSCYLMVSEIPMFALKFKSFRWADNRLRYSFLLVSLALLLVMGAAGFSAAIVLYVVLSVLAARRPQAGANSSQR